MQPLFPPWLWAAQHHGSCWSLMGTLLQGTAAASLTPSWAILPTTAMAMAPSVSAAATHRPSPPRLSGPDCLPVPSLSLSLSLQGTAPPAAPRASRTACALQRSPMATWVSAGAAAWRLPWPPQSCCCATAGTRLCPSPCPRKGLCGTGPSVPARSGVCAGATGVDAHQDPRWGSPRSCSGNSGFPLKDRSSSSGARPPPR